jgi:hypothetical protein
MSHLCSVVVHDLDVEGIAILPAKAYAPLIVDTDAPLAFRSPFNFSNRLPGGALRSVTLAAAPSKRSLRKAIRSNERKRLTRSRWKGRSVSRSAKERITAHLFQSLRGT